MKLTLVLASLLSASAIAEAGPLIGIATGLFSSIMGGGKGRRSLDLTPENVDILKRHVLVQRDMGIKKLVELFNDPAKFQVQKPETYAELTATNGYNCKPKQQVRRSAQRAPSPAAKGNNQRAGSPSTSPAPKATKDEALEHLRAKKALPVELQPIARNKWDCPKYAFGQVQRRDLELEERDLETFIVTEIAKRNADAAVEEYHQKYLARDAEPEPEPEDGYLYERDAEPDFGYEGYFSDEY